MILHLGVIDAPYADKGSETTATVAKKLEKTYSVMQNFFNLHGDEVAKSLETSTVAALENVLNGAPQQNVFGDATSEIEEMFKFTFLAKEEMAQLGVKGVPTKASIERRSLRFKKGVNQNGRPSFIDTGLYQKSFKAWIE
jgi:hypothetical protein